MTSDHFRGVRRAGWLMACVTLLASGCDFLDPTEVTNPNTTAADLAESDAPTEALLPGLRAGLARAVRSVVNVSDLLSDNLEIAFTNITGELGGPHQLNPYGGSYNSTGGIGAYWNLQELRALSDFVIDSIAPDDDTATDDLLAEAHYIRGMAYLMQGENFIAVPTAPDQEPTGWEDLLGLALTDLNTALSLGSDPALSLKTISALARAHRALGNRDEAEQFARDALGLDDEFVVLQHYAAGEIENPVFGDDRTRQPLPRLDFLDPKYVSRDAPIPITKAEGMHLILAEVAMAGGGYATAAAEVAAAVAIAHERPMGEIDDSDQRLNPDLTPRPSSAGILVRADASAPARAGLVLARPGVVSVPTISGTSLDADSVAALTDPAAIRHAFWLARQEIFYLEGRRSNALGVRWPITGREINASPVIEVGDPATEVQVPSWIPNGVIDDFSPRSPYDSDGQVVEDVITIAVDMNRILAEQKVSAFGPLP